MKKIVLCASCFVLGAVAAFAEPSWALLNTDPTDATDTTGSYANRYTAYLCTKEAAKTLFGGNDTIGGITAYLGENAVDYAAGMTAMAHYGFDEGQYGFSTYFTPGSLVGDYIAVVAYAGGAGEDDMVRVFETRMSGDSLTFDPALPNGGTAGAWATAAVPEPTSGMLFLLGLASLALRRKRGEGEG